MSLARDRNICSVIPISWQLLMICGCAYVVFWKDRSGWWFALALLLATAIRCRAVDDSKDTANTGPGL